MSDVRTELQLKVLAHARGAAQEMLNEVKRRLSESAVDDFVLALIEAGLQHLDSRGKSFRTIRVGKTIMIVADGPSTAGDKP